MQSAAELVVPTSGTSVDLSAEEVRLVLKACARFRCSLPLYLQSCQADLETLDAVVRKLDPGER